MNWRDSCASLFLASEATPGLRYVKRRTPRTTAEEGRSNSLFTVFFSTYLSLSVFAVAEIIHADVHADVLSHRMQNIICLIAGM